MNTYPGLDSIRALAAGAVLVTHVAFWSGLYSQGLAGALLARLDIGVAIFFVLSGFLLSSPFLSAAANGSPQPSVPRYFWKRALRILPLYWLVVTVALIGLPSNNGASLQYWISNITLTQIYFFDVLPFGLTQMWSLSTEVAFYVLLPIFGFVVAKRSTKNGWRPNRMFVVLGIFVILSVLWLMVAPTLLVRTATWLPSYFSWFAAGIALAILRIEESRGSMRIPILRRLANQPGVSWLIAGSLYLIAATPIAGPVMLVQPTGSEAVVKNLLYAVIAYLVISPSVLKSGETTRYEKFIENRHLRHLGLISYGIFSIHLLVLHAVSHFGNYGLFDGHFLERLLLVTIGTIVASEITYRVLELPVIRLKDWSPFRKNPKTAPTQADAIM